MFSVSATSDQRLRCQTENDPNLLCLFSMHQHVMSVGTSRKAKLIPSNRILVRCKCTSKSLDVHHRYRWVSENGSTLSSPCLIVNLYPIRMRCINDFILMFRHSLAHLDLFLLHRDPAYPDSFIVTDGTSLYDELLQHLTKFEQLNLRVETVCAFAEYLDSIIRSFQTGERFYLFSTSMNLCSFRLMVIHVDPMPF